MKIKRNVRFILTIAKVRSAVLGRSIRAKVQRCFSIRRKTRKITSMIFAVAIVGEAVRWHRQSLKMSKIKPSSAVKSG